MDLWKELGVSSGTAIVVLIALYFVIRAAVKGGVTSALLQYKQLQEDDNETEESTLDDEPEK